MEVQLPADCPVTYEQLIAIENEFDEIDTKIILKQYQLTASVFAKRQELISKIPNFWPIVFEQCPTDIDQFITPSDSDLINRLTSLRVSRFEVDAAPVSGPSGASIVEHQGNPRSIAITFEFGPNEWIEDQILEKKFWHRRARDGWVGLVSEPVKIRWKKGHDLTEGFTDAAVRLFEAQKKANMLSGAEVEELPEYQSLLRKRETNANGLQSFFAFFGYRGRYVSAAESEEAVAKERERRERRKRGEKAPHTEVKAEHEDMDDSSEIEAEAEIFPAGEELAVSIAEDLWPSAIKYWSAAAAMEEEQLSDANFEEEEEDADHGDRDGDGDEDEDEHVMADIRGLVKGKGSDENLPPKKRRKT